jgi:uncharacterized membrane protein HdeD (DUF308 family)
MSDQATTSDRPSFESAIDEGEQLFARIWKFMAVEGALAIAFGMILIIWPDIGLSAMVWTIGIYALVRGVVTGVGSLVTPVEGREKRWLVAQAIVSTAIGIAVLIWPDISAKALLYVIAGYAIAVGVLIMGSALYLPVSGGRKLLLTLSGMIFVVIGAVMFIEPGAGALAQIALVASLLIVTGTTTLALAFQLRELAGDTKREVQRRPTTTTKPVANG